MFIGVSAPSFSLPDVSGDTVSLASVKEELVAVVFSCNHCPYVKAYEQRLIKLQKEYQGRVKIIAINANDAKTHPDDSFEKMKKNATAKGFNFTYLRDEGAPTARAFQAKYTPEVFLLGKDRTVRYHGRIDDCWQSETGVKRRDLKEAIEDLLNNRDVAVKSTTPVGCTIKWP